MDTKELLMHKRSFENQLQEAIAPKLIEFQQSIDLQVSEIYIDLLTVVDGTGKKSTVLDNVSVKISLE